MDKFARPTDISAMSEQRDMTGDQFRDERVTHGLTQKEVGEELGVKRQTIHTWEKRGPALVPRPAAMALRLLKDTTPEKDLHAPKPAPKFSRYDIGTRFGTLTVERIMGRAAHGHIRLAMRCDCGRVKGTRGHMLRKTSKCSRFCPAELPKPGIPMADGSLYDANGLPDN